MKTNKDLAELHAGLAEIKGKLCEDYMSLIQKVAQLSEMADNMAYNYLITGDESNGLQERQEKSKKR